MSVPPTAKFGEDNTETPEERDDTATPANLVEHSRSGSSPESKKKKSSGKRPEFVDIDEEPLKRRTLIFQDAHRLATMPRHKRDEATQSAFWAAVVSIVSGLAGFYDLAIAKTPAQPIILDITEILILGICVAVWIFALFRQSAQETAEEYLNRLYNVQSQPQDGRKG